MFYEEGQIPGLELCKKATVMDDLVPREPWRVKSAVPEFFQKQRFQIKSGSGIGLEIVIIFVGLRIY